MRVKKILLLIGLVVSFGFLKAPMLDIRSSPAPVVVVEEKKSDIDYEKICYLESRGKDSVVSSEGAIGVMQITPITLKEWNNFHPNERYTKADLYNRTINTKIGVWLLAEQIPYYLNNSKIPIRLNHKLISYNWGVTNFINWYSAGQIYADLPAKTRRYLIDYSK